MSGLQILKASENIKKISSINSSYELKVLDDNMEIMILNLKHDAVIICQPYECDNAINYYYIISGLLEYHKDKTLVRPGDSISAKDITESAFFKAIEDTKVLWAVNKSIFKAINYEREKVEELLRVIQEKDHYTHQHCKRVARLASEIARRVRLTDNQIVDTINAATCHDVGKMNVSMEILNKTGILTAEEYEIIKKHAIDGFEVINSEFDINVAKIVSQHHERLDGKGYPYGLIGDQIMIEAKIIAVADSYDAMIIDRPYRIGMKSKDALKELKRCIGTHYEKEIVDVFEEYLIEEGIISPEYNGEYDSKK
jgi:putative nucleotidyltransferase with HDIG domain